MRYALLALALLTTACTTTEEVKRAQMTPWIGKPVRELAEANSLVPADVQNTADGRTFIFQKPGVFGSTCGITVWAVPAGSEFVIKNMASSCPPGSL